MINILNVIMTIKVTNSLWIDYCLLSSVAGEGTLERRQMATQFKYFHVADIWRGRMMTTRLEDIPFGRYLAGGLLFPEIPVECRETRVA